jgi:hypothetical protein
MDNFTVHDFRTDADFERRLAASRAKVRAEQLGTSPLIKLVPFADIKLGNQRRYLVKGLIPRVGLTVVWGPPKCGKSFWTFDVAMHIALGWEYRERRVHQGAVIYCCFEGQTGMQARVEAYRQRRLAEEPDTIPLFLEPVTLDLVRDHQALIASVKATLGTVKPVMVVLDTLNRSLRGSESSDEDMSAYIKAADAIREQFSCAVVVVHHCGIDGTRPRGHTSLTGACDAQLSVLRDGTDNVIVTVEEMKDGPNGDVIASRLEPVDVGTDVDGEAITSCVIVPFEGELPKADRKRRSAKYELAIRALRELVADQGAPLPSTWGLPISISAIPVELWRATLLSQGNIEEDRRRFWDLKQALKRDRVVAERDGRIWLASS